MALRSSMWGGPLLLVLLGGCSDDGSLDANAAPDFDGGAASGGAAASGGTSNGGSSGSGASQASGGAATMNEHAACVAYYEAQCMSRARCEGLSAPEEFCIGAAQECPDRLFAPGANWTIQDALACAEVWKSVRCEDVTKLPSCAVAGSRAEGESCRFAFQCASRNCSFDTTDPAHPDCGKCIPDLLEGSRCGTSQGPGSCTAGYECLSSTAVCTEVVNNLPAGSPCTRAGQCAPGYWCFNADSPAATCGRLPLLGESCATENLCGGGAVCSAAKVCEPRPSAGSACAGPSQNLCADDAFCDVRSSGNVCVARTPRGGTCTAAPQPFVQEHCQAGLFCVCTDDTCSAATCVELRTQDQPCGDTNTRCFPGTECVSGVCRAADLQGIFTADCGP